MELNLLFVHGESIGYGRYGVFLARELERMGVEVYDHLPGTEQDPRAEHLNKGRNSKVCETVAWISVPTHARGWWKGQRPVISTMWESARLPESFRETLHEFETVIVPSRQNVDLFSQYHDNVKFVPLGVDPDDWHFVPRREPGATFDFLIGGSGPRKGTDLAHKAFRKLWGKEGSWGSGPVPQLLMKNPKSEPFHGDRVHVIGGRLPAQDEIDLYASALCYLQPSRGEGFGLQPLQAIAQGMPTILTGAHGHDAFAHLGLPIGYTMAEASYFIYGDAGLWWEPSLDDLCDRMKWVYDNYETACAQAERSAATVADSLTWAHTARAFVDAVGPENLGGHTGPGEWYEPQAKRYLVMVNQRFVCDIAGTTFAFTPGRQYWELADVKRILMEGGILDPACLNEDDGLTQRQVDRIPGYTAAHAHCPTCHQRLGGKTRSDEIFEELEAAAR